MTVSLTMCYDKIFSQFGNMNGAKILGYRTVSICLINGIANVIPEMLLEGRAGDKGCGSGFSGITILNFT